jgi:hypothetical protein
MRSFDFTYGTSSVPRCPSHPLAEFAMVHSL